MPLISPFITYETLHCVHQHKRKDEPTSNPQNNGFNDGVPKKIAGLACVIKLPKPVPQSKTFAQVGECFWLRDRIDIARPNQKPLLHIARTNHLAVFDTATNLRRLNFSASAARVSFQQALFSHPSASPALKASTLQPPFSFQH